MFEIQRDDDMASDINLENKNSSENDNSEGELTKQSPIESQEGNMESAPLSSEQEINDTSSSGKADVGTNIKANHANTEEAVKNKKAAGEVFMELKQVVLGMDYKMDEINRFVHLAKDKLVRQESDYIRQGKMDVLESFFELHDLLFRRVKAMEAAVVEPDNFNIELLKFVREILAKHDIDVIEPQPGEVFDMNYMESFKAEPARFWRVPDTIAHVDKCGYIEQVSEIEEKVLRPARVTVYRK